jgi:Xaa-Pro aminopeptidase
MKRFSVFSFAIAILTLSLISISVFVPQVNADSASKRAESKPSIIRVAPPAPVFDQATRLSELAERRARVAKEIGPGSILILFSAEPRVYTNDVDYPFRQENNLFYLTSLKQSGATLVLMPGNPSQPEVLFLPRRIPAAEVWSGHMYSADEASRISGLKEIWDAKELDPFLKALASRQPFKPKPENVFMTAATSSSDASASDQLLAAAAKNEAVVYLLTPRGPDNREYRREFRFSTEWPKTAAGFTLKNAFPIFSAMRLRKSPMELRLLQHAIDITSEALQRSWLAAGTAKWEYEIDANVLYTFKLRNADNWGYPSIVGCGLNATTLHYIESQGEVKSGDLLLMDVGAEYEHYTADVTRTIPVNGKFTPAQAEIYQIVYEAQEAAARATKPGARISDVDRAATQVIKEGLLKLGLITDINSNQHRLFFMHGTSHWLGMNVHDVGDYAAKLEPGMVFTNEPGIYVRADALDYQPYGWQPGDWEKFKETIRPAYEKYKGIGVRIEDDMLVTADGARWMTEALPRTISEIEDFIAKGK